jgi:hypothetical protein
MRFIIRIKKIISGGQTGAEQAALEVAITFDLTHGGWVPKDRLAENGVIPAKYQLIETPSNGYTGHMERNVLESDATLIISRGGLTGGALISQKRAILSGRPCLHIDLYITPVLQAVSIISSWTRLNRIEILNVTGQKADPDSMIYQDTVNLLEKALYVNFFKNIVDEFLAGDTPYFQNFEDVVNQIAVELPFKQKVILANLRLEELETLQYALDLYISSRLETADAGDIDSPRRNADRPHTFIMEKLWNRLRQTHRLKVIK